MSASQHASPPTVTVELPDGRVVDLSPTAKAALDDISDAVYACVRRMREKRAEEEEERRRAAADQGTGEIRAGDLG